MDKELESAVFLAEYLVVQQYMAAINPTQHMLTLPAQRVKTENLPISWSADHLDLQKWYSFVPHIS